VATAATLLGLLVASPATWAGTFRVDTNARNDLIPGTLDWAIEQSNASTSSTDLIDFVTGAFTEPIVVGEDDPFPLLPVIDLGVDGTGELRVVELDSRDSPGVRIRAEEDLPDGFVLLHVMSGRATLIDLDIAGGNLLVDGGAELGLDYERDFAISDSIVGGGRVIKEGPGLLLLDGTNTYIGGTEIVEGVLDTRIGSLQGDFAITEDASLRFENTPSDDHIYRTATPALDPESGVTGEGRFVKAGQGLLELSSGARLRHSGGTTIENGTLRGSTTTLSGDVAISSPGELDFTQGNSGAFAGNISGAGSVRKGGGGEVQLSGSNTFTGGLFIDAGSVRGTTSSIPGNVSLGAPSTAITFDQGVSGSHFGAIAGSGAIVKRGSGLVALTGISTHTGGTQIFEGTLQGDTTSLVGDIQLLAPGAVVDFSHADLQRFTGAVSGTGALHKSGPGVLRIDSAQSYVGETRVRGGTLRMGVALPDSSQVVVDAPGTFESALSIGGDLIVSGAVAAGAETDSLSVGGSASLLAGSTLRTTVDDLGNAANLSVAGNATIDDAILNVDILPGDYSTPTTYTALTAAAVSSPTGTGFTSVTPDYAFLDVSLPVLGAGSVTFDVTENTSRISDFAITPNQRSTAPALGQLLQAGTADSDRIKESIIVLTKRQVPIVLDQMAGEPLSAFTNTRLQSARLFARSLSQRFTSTRFERKSVAGRARSDVQLAAFEPQRSGPGWGAWLEPFGIFGSLDGAPNSSSIDSNMGGVSGGLDYRFSPRSSVPGAQHFRVGIGLGYTYTSLSTDFERMTGSGNTAQAALYGAYQSERFYVGIAGRYAYSDLSTERRITFQSIDRLAHGDSFGHEGSALIEAGARLGNPKRVRFQPLAGFLYTHLTQSPFSERGAGSLGLSVQESSIDSMLTTLGLRVSRIFTLKGEYGIEPEVRLGWTHEFGDRERVVTARFQGVPGAVPFPTLGASPDADSLWVGAGYVMSISALPLVSLNYDAYIGSRAVDHNIRAGLYFRW
jgi:outer membrane autotransporter protein